MSNIATLRAGASALLPIYPTTFDDVVRLARMSIIAGMTKPQKSGYGDNQKVETDNAIEARATMIILQGMELGLPMQSVQLLAMINGRITAHSEAVPGILLSKGFKIKQEFIGKEFEDGYKAVCTLTRPDGDFVMSEFSVKDAKDAGLWDDTATITDKWGKTKPNDSAWFRYKKRMLWARALGFAAKDKGSDAMKGLMVREEMEDFIRSERARDVTPAIPTMLEIPDIPDQTPATPVAAEASQDVADDPIADVDGYLAKLGEELTFCTSAADLDEITLANADMIDRLPKSAKAKAKKMLKDAME